MRLLIMGSCTLFALLTGGCQGKAEPPKKGVHGEQQPVIEADKKVTAIISAVKRAILDENKSKSVGKALEDYRYFIGREWRETAAKKGTIYVDFFGTLDPEEIAAALKKEGVVARNINIKFVVKPDDSLFVGMITIYDTKNDGKVYPISLTDIAGVMNAIYANTKLPLVSVSSDSPWRQTVIK